MGKRTDTLYTSEYLTIKWHEEKGYLLADWSGILDANRARAGCTQVLQCLNQQPASKILNNNTKVTGHYPGAIDWVGRVWFPSMHSLGVKYFAWVYSPDFYTQLNIDEIVRLSSKVKIQTFYDLESAELWLLHLENSA
ncbi:hypothetical protein [Pontibacter ruber]|uniref:STAS/SEC14 domain-containing protein n=1 Tax=Pontibacter ruber TaxID=1343895 RepID=A0ABW5CV33_9BACT|nr:hypothetical protein [Pontibacter ruber]